MFTQRRGKKGRERERERERKRERERERERDGRERKQKREGSCKTPFYPCLKENLIESIRGEIHRQAKRKVGYTLQQSISSTVISLHDERSIPGSLYHT